VPNGGHTHIHTHAHTQPHTHNHNRNDKHHMSSTPVQQTVRVALALVVNHTWILRVEQDGTGKHGGPCRQRIGHEHACTRTHTCTHARTHTNTLTYTDTPHTHTQTRALIHMQTHAHTHTHVHTHTNTHTHTYTHTYILSHSAPTYKRHEQARFTCELAASIKATALSSFSRLAGGMGRCRRENSSATSTSFTPLVRSSDGLHSSRTFKRWFRCISALHIPTSSFICFTKGAISGSSMDAWQGVSLRVWSGCLRPVKN
jgi:hypothetical protein